MQEGQTELKHKVRTHAASTVYTIDIKWYPMDTEPDALLIAVSSSQKEHSFHCSGLHQVIPKGIILVIKLDYHPLGLRWRAVCIERCTYGSEGSSLSWRAFSLGEYPRVGLEPRKLDLALVIIMGDAATVWMGFLPYFKEWKKNTQRSS